MKQYLENTKPNEEYPLYVTMPEKNAAREQADQTRYGKMLGRLMRLSEEKPEQRQPTKKRRI